jgi:hypothetical protein
MPPQAQINPSQANRNVYTLIIGLSAFIGLVFCVITYYEGQLMSQFQSNGKTALAQVTGSQTVNIGHTDSDHLRVVFATQTSVANLGEIKSNFSFSADDYQMGDTLTILHLPQSPKVLIRKVDLPQRAYLPFFVALAFTLLMILIFLLQLKNWYLKK